MYLLLLIFCMMIQYYFSKRLKNLQKAGRKETNLGITGKEIVQFLLFQKGITTSSIKKSKNGNNHDNSYNRENELTQNVNNEASLVDKVVAAYETARSMQYKLLSRLRVIFTPVKIVQIVSMLGFGIGGLLSLLIDLGNFPKICVSLYVIILFVESLLCLAIERDAWMKTHKILNQNGMQDGSWVYKRAKKISNTAFATYVCQTIICVIIMLMVV